jgi:hypothetical protein
MIRLWNCLVDLVCEIDGLLVNLELFYHEGHIPIPFEQLSIGALDRI